MKAKGFVKVVLGVLFITVFGSCTSKEEKLYGKVETKDKEERALIEKVQNAYFNINPNVTLKEAVAANRFSKNITWSITELERLGTYIVSFQYDIDPVNEAMRMDFFEEYDDSDSVFFKIFFVLDYDLQTRKDNLEVSNYESGAVLSPIGYANIFSRFIQGEIVSPHTEGIEDKMQALLDAYTEYRKDYEEINVFIPPYQIPETLPEPFFIPTAIKFQGDCVVELMSDDIEFVQFSVLFDFKTPYLDNKEYKGVGVTINDDTPLRNNVTYRYQRIKTEMGLRMVYENLPIGMLYPFATRPVTEY
jgi:hypothetical protein